MGGKSGGGGHTPYEAPDSLKSAQRLRAIGLISLGPIKGSVNKWKSTFFDNTPIQNENGVDDNDEESFNFKNTEIQFNLGTQDQLPLKGFEASEREVSVSTELKNTTPITRTVIDPDVTRIRLTLGVNALFEQNDQGDTNGTSVVFEVLINNIYRATYEINGKSSSRFFRSYIIDELPARPFTITVKRITADSKSQRLQNATSWSSYTEIIDTKLSYPNMAVVGIKTDSRYNPNFPNINFLLDGRIIKVPTTYDPEKRTYATGIWKGDFKEAWTNNPAWIFYDLVTNSLAGLGKRLSDYGLDKFQLYQIAQYCDQLVPDGYGGKEPRMTANLWITEQRNAYDVLSDMASVFRAITVWNGMQFTSIQDRPADPICTYSQANVIDGKFSRQYAAQKSIFTAVEVEYADERNMYQKAVEYVADDAMIARYGYNVKKMTAYATTSRGQAHRWGKWVLATSLLEQCTITFSVGRQGLMHLPGDIIEVADNNYAGKVLGGRVVAISGKKVTLDQPVDITGESYLSWLNDDMKLTKVKITQVDAKNKAIVTLASEPVGLEPMDDWVLKTPAVSTQLYRAIGITENDDGSYTITALQHEPQKEAIVDGSASFMPVATTAHTGGLSAIQNAEVMTTDGGILLTFTQPSFIGQGLKYQVKLYRDKKLYDIYDDLPEPQLAFNDLPDGEYVAEIRAKNAAGQLSEPKTVTFTVSFTITELVTVPRIFAIDLNWKNPLFANTKSSIELWVSSDNNFNNARKLVTLAYPTNSYTYSGLGLTDRFWFWARMTDGYNSGKFTEAVEGVPSSDSTQLTSYLDGQITKSHLGQSLIESLQSDINDAVAGEAGVRKSAVANAVSQIITETQARVKALQDEAKARTAAITAEANNRTKAIQAESSNLTKKIQDEANARGTAVTQLQQVDAQQAQLINAVTAKADQAIAGLQEEQTARANADKAEAQARNALTSRVASAESGIAEVRQSIATANSSIAEVSQNLNAKIDSLSVGGRNYVRNSEREIVVTAPNQRYIRVSTGLDSIEEPFVVSAFVKDVDGNNGNKLTVIMADPANANNNEQSQDCEIINGRIIAKFNTLSNPHYTQILLYANSGAYRGSATGTVTYYNIKLELGNVATDWTPAPEDADSAISAVSADLTSYKQTQATKEQATSQQINGLTTRLANNESGISRVEKAVSDNQSSTATQLNQLSANLTKAQTDLNAKITQEQTARADADKANADRITSVTSRVASAESSISNIQSTKASKTEVASLAQQSLQSVWQADAKAELDKIKVGGRNLLKNSNARYESNNYSTRYELSTAPQVGDEIVVTLWGSLGETRSGIGVYNSHGFIELAKLVKVKDGVYQGRGTWKKPMRNNSEVTPNDTHLNVYFYPNGDKSTNVIDRIKLELGTLGTDWTPAPEDADSAINAVSSKVDSVQQTLTTANQALGSRIDTVTASVNDAKSQVSQVSKAVSDVSGKLSATHTLKTQVIGGGKTAFAGIALGATADNKTKESSVIIMADKFGVVKNASDGNVVSMLSVVNNKVAINGDLIADGAILGKHIRASQTLTSPNINGGSLNIGNGNFIVDSSGNVTAKKGTFSGNLSGATRTFKGDISAASGTFSGKIYAKNLIDDTAQAFTLQHGKSLTIPAFGKKRILIVPACFCESQSKFSFW
ncbi:phage tail protein [Actinobacillus equuli subsp. haemolyticus]|uniref:TipJ family phage tail tip protein n=1 Tax=Actinobacillus equuli TaxID=718 RepID=UPI002418581F|nr:phage tail protein [Actinobacillus equuli]MDG4948437.1 phage tail protein [Actinobacillus equuli subsp. haemolyticus]